jgi:hypothetical protein
VDDEIGKTSVLLVRSARLLMVDDEVRARREATVLALDARAASLREEGARLEMMSRAIHAGRRCLTSKFKALTPEPRRSQIRRRTHAVYGAFMACLSPAEARAHECRSRN